MAKKQNYWYVLVLTEEGPKFVTKINYANKTAEWDKLEAPLEMSMERAKDLALGLMCNFHMAYPVCARCELEEQPYFYDKGQFEWNWNKEEENND